MITIMGCNGYSWLVIGRMSQEEEEEWLILPVFFISSYYFLWSCRPSWIDAMVSPCFSTKSSLMDSGVLPCLDPYWDTLLGPVCNRERSAETPPGLEGGCHGCRNCRNPWRGWDHFQGRVGRNGAPAVERWWMRGGGEAGRMGSPRRAGCRRFFRSRQTGVFWCFLSLRGKHGLQLLAYATSVWGSLEVPEPTKPLSERLCQAKFILKPGQLHGAQSLLHNTPMEFRCQRAREMAEAGWLFCLINFAGGYATWWIGGPEPAVSQHVMGTHAHGFVQKMGLSFVRLPPQ